MLRHKVNANQLRVPGKHLKVDHFVEQESLPEKMNRFFKSIDDTYQQPSQTQVLQTYQQAHQQQIGDQIKEHNVLKSEATSDDDAAYHAEIDRIFKRIYSIGQQSQLQPLQQMTDTPTEMTEISTTYTPTKMIDTSTTYTPTPSMYTQYTYMPSIHAPINYPYHYYTYPLYPGYAYSHMNDNYGVCQGETDNNYNYTDHADHNY